MKTTHERFDEEFEVELSNNKPSFEIFVNGANPTNIKAFIDQEIERAVAEERKRIVEMIKEVSGRLPDDLPKGTNYTDYSLGTMETKLDILKIIANEK